jgi:hypothetical protein
LSYRLRSTPPGAPKAAAHPWTYRGAARRADPAIEEARPIPRCAAGGRAAGEVGQPPGPADLKRVISRP